jgi:hypothetical protein
MFVCRIYQNRRNLVLGLHVIPQAVYIEEDFAALAALPGLATLPFSLVYLPATRPSLFCSWQGLYFHRHQWLVKHHIPKGIWRFGERWKWRSGLGCRLLTLVKIHFVALSARLNRCAKIIHFKSFSRMCFGDQTSGNDGRGSSGFLLWSWIASHLSFGDFAVHRPGPQLLETLLC